MRRRAFSALIAALVASLTAVSAASGVRAPDATRVRVIIGLREPTVAEGHLGAARIVTQRQRIRLRQDALLARLPGVRRARRFRTIPFVAADVDARQLAALRRDPDVTSIEDDLPARATLAQSVPLVGAPAAWAMGYSGAGWSVAVLDTGVDADHPFLHGKVVSEACYSNAFGDGISLCPGGAPASTADGSARDCAGYLDCEHGTHVAGIVAGRSASLAGVAHDATLIVIQVFTGYPADDPICGGAACLVSYSSDQILALEHVLALRTTFNIAAVNLSLGGSQVFQDTASCDAANPSRKAAIDNLRSAGIATVIAAGNAGATAGTSAPACISSAVSVGATTKADTIASFSNTATFLSAVAPGVSILSSVPGGGFAAFSGTSMAAPHVAGAWALMKSRKPGASVTEVLEALRATAVPIADTRVSESRVYYRPQIDRAIPTLRIARITLDAPASGTVPARFVASGWAIDETSAAGSGVDAVHMWAFPRDGSPARFVGSAPYGGSRPDVGAVFGARFAASGFSLAVDMLPPGDYDIEAFAHSAVTGAFDAAADASITVLPPVSMPLMAIDTPQASATVPGTFTIAGWAIDEAAPTGSGVDAIHVWAFPASGAAPIFAGSAPYGGARPDVAAAFGGQFLQSSYQMDVHALPPGTYTVVVYAHSAVTGAFTAWRAVALAVTQ